MIIKRYIANTTQEAMAQVKMDLGSDAVILNTRRIRKKGIIGWFSKPLMEVTAAIDNEIVVSKGKVDQNTPQTKEVQYNKDVITSLEKKVDAMGQMVQKLVSQVINNNQKKTEQELTVIQETINEGKEYYDVLLDNEVRQEYAVDILKKAKELYSKNGMDFCRCFEHVIMDCLGNKAKPIELLPGKRKVILFVGPTGVGKTTTLAKLAANFTIEQNKKVGLITADTYRIAAVDQLRVYAEILEIPMSIIYEPSQITTALEEHADKDVVLIDTAGRSMKDKDHEKEINELIALGDIDEIHLVISSNTSPQGCVNVINTYSFLPNYSLLFTKLDEVTTYGTILNCRLMSNRPISYITTGQNVPTDIEIANINKIKDLLIGNKKL
ncbi:MAG: flagellar biosynthesis protein FlhF [Caldicoprobacterales bacterium]|nr:flagellar biosynthesis protein FlhF [Clostridiales bacterium]